MRQETQRMGELQAQQEAELRQRSQAETYLQTRLRLTGPQPQQGYGSIDAGKVRLTPQALAEKQADSEVWRDLKLGCWCEAEAVRAAQRSARQREKYDREQQVYRANNIRYYGDIAEA